MGIGKRARAIRADLQRRRARLPWADLEAEARRQRCSPADIFFDWTGRMPERELATPHALGRRRQVPLDAVGSRRGLETDPAGRHGSN